MCGAIPPLPQYVLMAWCLEKHRDDFAFTFLHYTHTHIHKSRHSSVGIALGYGLDDRGSRFLFPAGAGNFSLHHSVQNGSGAHPDSYPMGTMLKRPGRKADHSPPSSAEVKE
jgi:hypothetical protein